jgi:hypothetical protein
VTANCSQEKANVKQQAMKKQLAAGIVLCCLGAGVAADAQSQQRPALPPNNPYLIQNSVYPSIHFNSAQTDTTTLPV